MIRKIGLIYQDRNSFGFLKGLRDRLRCSAEFIEPPAAIGNVQCLPRKNLRWAWEHFRRRGVDLVVRLTDADGDRWQHVRRTELGRVPQAATSVWICGVAVENVEDWLCLDQEYAANELGVPTHEMTPSTARTGRIKRAISRRVPLDADSSDVVADLVRRAPTAVFQNWLVDQSMRTFYSDSRAAATRADCPTPNELGPTADA